MRVWTHIAGGESSWLLVRAMGGGGAVDPFSFAFSAVGSLLPDIDTPESLLGKLFPGSRYLSERFGHRTITHSLFGACFFGVLSLPLWLILGHFQWWLSFLVGYLSHLLLDMATVEGIELFWPFPGRAVFPGKDELRLDQSSPASVKVEGAVFVSLVFLSGALLPLSQVGITGALRRAIGGIEATLPEYREFSSDYSLFLSGTLWARLSGEVFQGEFPIAGTHGNGYVILVGDTLYSVGEGEEYDLNPAGKVRLIRGPPAKEEVLRVDLSGRPLGDLFSYLGSTGYAFGTLELEEPISPPILPDCFNPIRGSSRITLEFARKKDLLPFADSMVREGVVLVRRRVSGEDPVPLPPETVVDWVRPVSLKLKVVSLSDLLVREGDKVEEGDPLCVLATPELREAHRQLVQAKRIGGLLGALLEWLAGLDLESLRQKNLFLSPIGGTVEKIELEEGDEDGLTVQVYIRPGRLDLSRTGEGDPGDSSACDIDSYLVSPRIDHAIYRVHLKLIDSARETIDIAIYSFTDDDLGKAVVRAFRRGVRVRVIMDTSQPKARGGEYRRLTQAGIPVLVEEEPGLMHHKFMVIDGETVVTGSYNWSAAADDRNFENAIVVRDPEVARAFTEEFERLWEAISAGRTP